MKASLSKRELNRQRWQKIFETWKQSGESQQVFCKQHQLGLASFQRWRRIFEMEENQKGTEPISFIPVSVQDKPPSNLTVRVNNYLRIEVPTEFDPKALEQVIQVLRAL